MAENIEKGPNFVDPPDKAEAMAYAEKEQREKDARRERAGLLVNPDNKNHEAEKEGELWEEVQLEANKYIEENIGSIDKFLETDRKSYVLTPFSMRHYRKEEFTNTILEKIRAYLGEDSSDVSVIFNKDYQGSPHFILERKEKQEE